MKTWTNLGDLVDHDGGMDRVALVDARTEPAKIWTHAEVDALANGVANYLTDLGLKKGASVAILSLNRAEYAACYFGIMRAGFVAVPVNTKQPPETIRFVLQDSETVFAFVDTMGAGLIPEVMPHLNFDSEGDDSFAEAIKPGAFETVDVAPDDIAQILYTSGSTGRPKGVELSHHSQIWALEARSTGVATPEERGIIAQPLFHMNGLFSLKTTFSNNASTVLMPSFDDRKYLENLSRYEVTGVTAVPTMFARLLRHEDLLETLDFSKLTKILLGSAPMTEGLAQRIQSRFPNAFMGFGYGTTEAGPAIFGLHPDGLPNPPVTLGYPVDLSMVKLVDGERDDEGVLMMKNPSLMAGYRGMPEKTASVFRDGWYYSGDVMRRDENGFYFFVGRADDMFVCAGENIYPGEVEKMLETHPKIRQAVVVPLADEERSQMPVAFIVPAEGASLTTQEVKDYALKNGPTYQHPRRVLFALELPLAGTNKIDRRALIQKAAALEADGGWSVAAEFGETA
ncbi:acyl--CoA ligase [Hoeflea sp. WL0058]|uniref:Acyl--CoA ligase n=1 Tax=Flavimaribacter sediminis TaxID=2865987 RepID=A0AAE3D0N5_9HYPH|nr:class I adenylate-forming enzyme family protein [Flavimaribacter sediminis]MBW8638690.1 acyl--CoA ligase [Flavimaribacter sediminis]